MHQEIPTSPQRRELQTWHRRDLSTLALNRLGSALQSEAEGMDDVFVGRGSPPAGRVTVERAHVP